MTAALHTDKHSSFNIDNSRSYATEERLHKFIAEKLGSDLRYMVVRNREGRFTAVFGLGWNHGLSTAPIFVGFKVIA